MHARIHKHDISRHAATQIARQEDGRGVSVIVDIDPAATPLYFGELARKNPIQRATSLREKIERFRPQIRNDEQLLTKAELMRSEFYNEVLQPFGMHGFK